MTVVRAASEALPTEGQVVPGANIEPGIVEPEMLFAGFVREIDDEINSMHLERDDRVFLFEQCDAKGEHPSRLLELQTRLTIQRDRVEQCAAYPQRIDNFPDRIRGRSFAKFMVLLDTLESFLRDLESSIASYKQYLASSSEAEMKRRSAGQYANFVTELDRQVQFMNLEQHANSPSFPAKETAQKRLSVYHKWTDVFAAYPERIENFPDSIKAKSYEKFASILKDMESAIVSLGIYASILERSSSPDEQSADTSSLLPKGVAPLFPRRANTELPLFAPTESQPPQPVPDPPAARSSSGSDKARDFLNPPGLYLGPSSDPSKTSSSPGPFPRLPFPRPLPPLLSGLLAPASNGLSAAIDANNATRVKEFNEIFLRWNEAYINRGQPVPVRDFQWLIARGTYWIGQFDALKLQIDALPDSDASKAGLNKQIGPILGDLHAIVDSAGSTIASCNEEQAKRDAIVRDTNSYILTKQNEVIANRKAIFEAANTNWSNNFWR